MQVLACAQRAYGYTAMDYQKVSRNTSEPISLRVQTLVVILPDPNTAEIGIEPTVQFTVRLRSPESGTARLIGAFVDAQPVQLSIMSTSSDGDIEALVQVPTALIHRTEVNVDWLTEDHQMLATSNELIPITTEVRFQCLASSKRSGRLAR